MRSLSMLILTMLVTQNLDILKYCYERAIIISGENRENLFREAFRGESFYYSYKSDKYVIRT